MSKKKEIASKINSYFANISKEANLPTPTTASFCNIQSTKNSMCLFDTTPHEILSIINCLKKSPANANSFLPIKLIHKISEPISLVMSQLVNLSFKTGIFPDKLKASVVIPIYKSGKKSLICNYRPISLLPFFSKVFERCIKDRLLSFLLKYQLISSDQFGFRPKHSTSDALALV